VRLLDRGAGGVVPTPYGRALIRRSVAAFDELRQGVKDIEFLADPTAGEVRIAASIAGAAGFLADVIDVALSCAAQSVGTPMIPAPPKLAFQLGHKGLAFEVKRS
jgi:hypothetical protein